MDAGGMILQGDVIACASELEAESFDAVLCDPPYGLEFMGKRWDYDVPSVDLWRAVLRVLKPGAPLLAFGGTRTYHRLVVAIEDAGFEIRDQIAWIYGSGFPKYRNISKDLDKRAGVTDRPVVGSYKATGTAARKSATGGVASFGTSSADGGTTTIDPDARVYQTAAVSPLARLWERHSTALKPALEPACLARKPLEGTIAANVERWGVGGLAIDACRIGELGGTTKADPAAAGASSSVNAYGHGLNGGGVAALDAGRWPGNVILDDEAAADLDRQSGDRPSTPFPANDATGTVLPFEHRTAGGYSDSGGASRFFYVAKPTNEERDRGCADLPRRSAAAMTGSAEGAARLDCPRTGAGRGGGARNHHPTVKPVMLTRYLARLIRPPVPGRILVPFAGSGSEMIGAILEGWPHVIGIERDPEYVEIARARVALALRNPRCFEPFADRSAERVDERQISWCR